MAISNESYLAIHPADIVTMADIQPYLYMGVKIFLLIFLIIYTVVALFTLKQISLMTHTIKSKENKYIYIIGYLHLAAVLLCLLFTVTIL